MIIIFSGFHSCEYIVSHIRFILQGGRLLHWLPYKAQNKADGEKLLPEDFYHIYTNETLKINQWRPSQPNNKATKKEHCVKSYFGKKLVNIHFGLV